MNIIQKHFLCYVFIFLFIILSSFIYPPNVCTASFTNGNNHQSSQIITDIQSFNVIISKSSNSHFLAEAEKLDFPGIYHSIQPNGGIIIFSPSLSPGNVISVLLIYIFPITGLIFILFIIIGGIKYMTSAGDQKSIKEAKSILITTLLGFTIIFLSYWITKIISSILGLTDISSMF